MLRDAREQQRLANRAVESAKQHITHFKTELQAAKEMSDQWKEIKFEFDTVDKLDVQ